MFPYQFGHKKIRMEIAHDFILARLYGKTFYAGFFKTTVAY